MDPLDLKNRKILLELSKNCRVPLTQLAKRVGLSSQVVDYRIKQMIKNNIITDFITDISLDALGYARHTTYIQLKKVDEHQEKKIIDYFVHHPFITWVTTSTGKWSVIFDIVAKNVEHASSIMDELIYHYGEFFGDYTIASQRDHQQFPSKYYGFLTKQEVVEKKPILSVISESDRKLLRLLSHDARTHIVFLAKKLNMSATAVQKKMKKLIEIGVIRSFFVVPNKAVLKYEQYNLQFIFEHATPQQQKQFLAYIITHPNMNFYYRPMGHWDIEVGIFVKNPAELRKIMLDVRNKFSNIKIVDTLILYEEPKSDFAPEGVFSEIT